ncbi:MAG TPA: hypothetical protein DD706_15385 [Nitrospiraceae bacterium]|nr:hypothetical protein [Nitrospiraceae bacterium]
MNLTLTSTTSCPHCLYSKEEVMATDACQVVYACTQCGIMLKPKSGDYCVFCSYGTVPCHPIQTEILGE